MITKPTKTYVYKIYSTHHISPTCFGHSCGHLQGDALKVQIHRNITEVFLTSALIKHYKIQMKEYRAVCRTANSNTPLLVGCFTTYILSVTY